MSRKKDKAETDFKTAFLRQSRPYALFILRNPEPVRFNELVDAVAPVKIRPGIGELLKQKRTTSDLERGTQFPELGQFIEMELERHGNSYSGQGRSDLQESGAMREKLTEVIRKAVAGEDQDS